MASITVFELAKECGVSCRVLMRELEKADVFVRSTFAKLGPDQVKLAWEIAARLPQHPNPFAARPTGDMTIAQAAERAGANRDRRRDSPLVRVATLPGMERVIVEQDYNRPTIRQNVLQIVREEVNRWAAYYFTPDELREWRPTGLGPAVSRQCTQHGITAAMLDLPLTMPGKPHGRGTITNRLALLRELATVEELAAELARTGVISTSRIGVATAD